MFFDIFGFAKWRRQQEKQAANDKGRVHTRVFLEKEHDDYQSVIKVMKK